MGQYDVLIIGGVVAVGGWYVLTHPEEINALFPPTTTTPPVTDGTGDGGGGGGTTTGTGGTTKSSSSSTDCKKACTNGWCDTYRKKCSGSCSKCGGSSGGDSSGSSKSTDCKNFCNKGWCDSYRKRGCSGGCAACSGISTRTCEEKVLNSNCAGDCKSTCWRSRNSAGKIVQTCISKAISASACTAARSAFLKQWANVARVYKTQTMPYTPYNELRVTIV